MAAVIGAIVGGGGCIGFIFYYLRRYIDSKLQAKDEETQKRRDQRARRLRLDDEMQHAYGRMFYHIKKFIDTGYHNGDLEEAWTNLQDVESRKKDLDRDIIVEKEMDI